MAKHSGPVECSLEETGTNGHLQFLNRKPDGIFFSHAIASEVLERLPEVPAGCLVGFP